MRSVALLRRVGQLASLREELLNELRCIGRSATGPRGSEKAHQAARHQGAATPPHLWGTRGFAAFDPTAALKRKSSIETASDLGMYVAAAAIAMVGVSYAAVPLYRLFCAATGYGGALQGAQTVEDKLKKRMENPNLAVEKAAEEREITVWFNADVVQAMQAWKFKPTQAFVKVKPGKSTLVFFTAENVSDEAITGVSTYNVTPDRAAQYFNKIQCFCFEQQRLRPGELVDMPVFFYLDSELATDWNCRNVDDVTLSYTFHKVSDEDREDVEPDDAFSSGVRTHGPDGLPSTAVDEHLASLPPAVRAQMEEYRATLPAGAPGAAVAPAAVAVAAR